MEDNAQMVGEKLELDLPQETYIHTVRGSGKPVDFVIEPLPDDVMDMLQKIYDLGATIKTFPYEWMNGSDEPTSIFINFSKDTDVDQFGCKIVGINMKLHIHLLSNYPKSRMDRIQKYYNDLLNINEELPNQNVKYRKSLVVENTYEY